MQIVVTGKSFYFLTIYYSRFFKGKNSTQQMTRLALFSDMSRLHAARVVSLKWQENTGQFNSTRQC